MCNKNKCQSEFKKHNIFEEDYIWNPDTYSCQNGKYLASIIYDGSVVTCDEVIDTDANLYDEKTKSVLTNFNKKNI